MKKAARRRLLCVKKSNVIARSEATWQSPSTMFVTAQQFDGWYQEIPTALKGLGMTFCEDQVVAGRLIRCCSGRLSNCRPLHSSRIKPAAAVKPKM